jgi:hypothetical protein
MSTNNQIDQDAFTDEVIRWSNILYFRHSSDGFKFILPQDERSNHKPIHKYSPESKNQIGMIDKARIILSNENIKLRLCAALKEIGKDLSEIAKIVAGVLLPISLTGHSDIPPDPLLYASVSIVIFHSGVAAFCTGVENHAE